MKSSKNKKYQHIQCATNNTSSSGAFIAFREVAQYKLKNFLPFTQEVHTSFNKHYWLQDQVIVW